MLGGADQCLFFKNLSCSVPTIAHLQHFSPLHLTGMSWKHTEGLPTLRWWPESVFPGFPEMHHFRPANSNAPSPLEANFQPAFLCFDGYGLALNLSGNKTIGELHFGPKPAFLHPCHHSGRATAQIQPPTFTLDPKLIIFYAEVLQSIHRNQCVTSDVQFRKGA